MKILFAASEGVPYVKTGGLADVTHALTGQLATDPKQEVIIFLPYYQKIKQDKNIVANYLFDFTVPFAWQNTYCGLFQLVLPHKNSTYYFIDNDQYFGGRPEIYGCYDDPERFAFFSKAILESLLHLHVSPDVIHCNDWQTALIPLLLRSQYSHLEPLSAIKTVFTIHNIEYQGQTEIPFYDKVLGLSEEWLPTLRLGDSINFMKSAIILADQITTVSRTYAFEIQHAYFAHGLENILRDHSHKLCGIVNGIDTALFDPASNQQIVHHFDADDLEGKTQNKLALQKQLGLTIDPDIPMVAMISRLVAHKGLDLVEFVAEELMQLDLQFVVAGIGDDQFQNLFWRMSLEHPTKMSAKIQFDPVLAMQIYAASDLFLMPSKSEPCGLSQLIAMRFGSIPVVRETGGLVDTVPPLDPTTMEGRGFTFKSYNAHDMLASLQNALAFWQEPERRHQLIRQNMALDTSWRQPAEEYLSVYAR